MFSPQQSVITGLTCIQDIKVFAHLSYWCMQIIFWRLLMKQQLIGLSSPSIDVSGSAASGNLESTVKHLPPKKEGKV